MSRFDFLRQDHHYPFFEIFKAFISVPNLLLQLYCNDRIYAESQKQRSLERRIRNAKTQAVVYDAAGDEEAFAKMAAQVKRAQEAYKNYCKEVGRTPRLARTQVSGYNRSVSGKATQSYKRQTAITIGRSVGAKAVNYDVLDFVTGEVYRFVEGTYIQNVYVFAGKGSRTVYRNAYKYVEKFRDVKETKAEDWQHVKGDGVLDYHGEHRKAEVHWSQCEGIGRVDFFIKKWLE